MLPPLPRCSRWAYLSLKNRPAVSAFPDSTFGSACTLTFSRIARRLLTLRPAHSRGHQFRDRYPGASDISSPSCLPRLLPAGAVAGRGLHPLDKRRLVTAHVETGPSPTRVGATGLRRFRTSPLALGKHPPRTAEGHSPRPPIWPTRHDPIPRACGEGPGWGFDARSLLLRSDLAQAVDDAALRRQRVFREARP